MRDTWFAFHADPNPQYGRTDGGEPVVWSWDYDGASDVLRTRRPDPDPIATGEYWPRVKKTSLLTYKNPDTNHLHEFWRTMTHTSGSAQPALVMSGSARVVYQTPGKFEQDGLSHVAMQNEGLRMRGFTVRIDRRALHIHYDHRSVHAPGFDEHSRAKMDIVLRQIRYSQKRLHVKKLLFVFVDDIYASVLADMFVSFPRLAPRDVIVHLVHYESFRGRRIGLSRTREVIPGVIFSPY